MENIVEFPDKSLIETEASEWIVRFEGDTPPSQQDIEALKTWMARSPAHRQVLLQYASVWNDMNLLSELVLPMRPVRRPGARGLQQLLIWLCTPLILLMALTDGLKKVIGTAPGRWSIASVLVALGVLAVLSPKLLLFEKRPAGKAVYITSVGERSSHTLEDGSTLWLNTNSNVAVDYSPEKRRIVLHQGEAHFQVSKDPQRPFEVYAGTRMVRAVGTAFSVYRVDKAVKVTVTEGKVDLAVVKPRLDPRVNGGLTGEPAQPDRAAGETGEFVGSLIAGQSVLLADNEHSAVEEIVSYGQQELARRLSWREGLLVFAGEPLAEVVHEVSRYTPLRIDIADPALKTMRIGGQFQVGETEALFDVLKSGFGLEISRLGENHVEIHSAKGHL